MATLNLKKNKKNNFAGGLRCENFISGNHQPGNVNLALVSSLCTAAPPLKKERL